MSLSSLFLGRVLSTLYGAAFHFWRGGGSGRLLGYIFISLAGFWLGHFIAAAQGWSFIQLGALQLGGATGGSILFLLVGHWLGQIQGKGRT
jgi:hypothetical protein